MATTFFYPFYLLKFCLNLLLWHLCVPETTFASFLMHNHRPTSCLIFHVLLSWYSLERLYSKLGPFKVHVNTGQSQQPLPTVFSNNFPKFIPKIIHSRSSCKNLKDFCRQLSVENYFMFLLCEQKQHWTKKESGFCPMTY